MKQHISVDQFNELSAKAKKRLKKWWKPERGDWFIDSKYQETMVSGALSGIVGILAEAPFYPLLSIGQMIEFLSIDEELTIWRRKTDIGHWAYYVRGQKIMPGYELCDVLWTAVKEILED